MFTVNDDLSIYLTRGDTLFFNVRANDHGYPYTFKPGDIVRISVTAKKDVTDVYIQKDFPVYEASKTVFVYLEGRETKIGEKINKYKDYWYEIVLNPDTVPQTIIGNNDDGAKIFRLFPEADDVNKTEVLPEEIPVVDSELDMLSKRPVSNMAVAAAIARLTAAIEQLKGNMPSGEEPDGSVFNALGQVEGLSVLVIDAYGVALKNGFEGTVEEWLASLKGESGANGEKGDPGVPGPKGEPGNDGADGKSAYQYAKDGGYAGTEADFALKLASESSGIHIGPDRPTNETVDVWIDTDEEAEEPPAGKNGVDGKDGKDGADGKSAYEYAKDAGYTGSEEEFSAKLAAENVNGGVSSDWNAAEGEPGHIGNRTHWVDEEYKVFLDTTVSTEGNQATVVLNTELQQGENYTVTFMGQTYSCHCKYMKAMGQVALVIGNTLAIDGNNTGEPFAVAYLPWMGFTVVMTLLPDGDYPIKIEGNYKVYNKISRALLPKPIWVIDCDLDVDGPTVNVTQVELEPAIENGEFVALRDRMEGTTNFSILYFSGRSGGNLLFRQIPVGNGNAKYCILKPNISGGYDVVESII